MLLAAGSLFENLGKFAPTLLMLGGIALACFLLLRSNSLLFRRRGKDDTQQEVRNTRALLGERDKDSELADAPVDILRWQVEMHNTARELKGELDSKIMVVQALLNEVKAERLKLEQVLKQVAEQTKNDE